MVKNALTIDVEDYFQVSVFKPYISRSSWDVQECRVEQNIDRILELLARKEIKATFFTLGWIAARYPGMIKRLAAQGHEIASHGFDHERVTDLSPGEFYSDIAASKQILENLTGVEIKGYRAPSFSINKRTSEWAFECLARAGFSYSSSVYPIRHDHYGMPESPRFAYHLKSGILEVPISTVRWGGHNFPASGGGYFRLLPYSLSRRLFKHVNVSERQSVVFYFHPWEIDLKQPRLEGISSNARFRHYVNIGRMEARLIRLMDDFQWDRMDNIFLTESKQ